MLYTKVEIKKPSTTKEWVESIPFMVCEADVKVGEKRMSKAREAIAPIKEALAKASNQVLMVRICDLVEGEKNLETVSVDVDMESDDEGGSYASLGVSCTYAHGSGEDENEDNDGFENIEDEMQDWLSDEAQELYGAGFTGKRWSPQDFLKQLSQAVMGELEGPQWLAARESRAISEVSRNVIKPSKRSLSL